jgi:hypothetical protein
MNVTWLRRVLWTFWRRFWMPLEEPLPHNPEPPVEYQPVVSSTPPSHLLTLTSARRENVQIQFLRQAASLSRMNLKALTRGQFILRYLLFGVTWSGKEFLERRWEHLILESNSGPRPLETPLIILAQMDPVQRMCIGWKFGADSLSMIL